MSQDSPYYPTYGAALAAASSQSIGVAIDEVYPSADDLTFVLIGDASKIREAVGKYGPLTEMSIAAPHFRP